MTYMQSRQNGVGISIVQLLSAEHLVFLKYSHAPALRVQTTPSQQTSLADTPLSHVPPALNNPEGYRTSE